jgi:PhoPQ-activated pathogenicity-related protein
MPKLIVNGANDPYWTVDALNLYWDDLKGDKWVVYVPNAGHDLKEKLADGKTNRVRANSALAAFVRHQTKDNAMPKLTWKHDEQDGKLRVSARAEPAPKGARLWVAHAPTRDFRKAEWKEQPATLADGTVAGLVERPKEGYVAFFAEMDFEIDGLKHPLSTQLRVVGAK